jgi:hypothetical protein
MENFSLIHEVERESNNEKYVNIFNLNTEGERGSRREGELSSPLVLLRFFKSGEGGDLCNVSQQYHIYKKHFHYDKNKRNLIKDIEENKQEITMQLFPLFIIKISEIIQYFKLLDKKINTNNIHFHYIFTSSMIDSDLLIQFYNNEEYIKLLFTDILKYLYHLNPTIKIITIAVLLMIIRKLIHALFFTRKLFLRKVLQRQEKN